MSILQATITSHLVDQVTGQDVIHSLFTIIIQDPAIIHGQKESMIVTAMKNQATQIQMVSLEMKPLLFAHVVTGMTGGTLI